MGLGASSKNLFLIDFGLSRQYKDASGVHISLNENKGLIGTARYASVNAHLGVEQSRRDDLEAIGYVLIYFLKGKLPWQNLPATQKKEKYAMISAMKMNTPLEVLCEDLPKEFSTFLTYVKSLLFEETPNYKYLKRLLRKLFVESGYDFDYNYDWNVLNVVHPTIPLNKIAKINEPGITEAKNRVLPMKSMPFGHPKMHDSNSPQSKAKRKFEEDKWSGSEEIEAEPDEPLPTTHNEIMLEQHKKMQSNSKKYEPSSMNNTSKMLHWSGIKLIKSEENDQMPDGPVEVNEINSNRGEESLLFLNLKSPKSRADSPELTLQQRHSDKAQKKGFSVKNLSQSFSRQSLFGRFMSLRHAKYSSEVKPEKNEAGILFHL
jgi:hypothetical protein